MKRITNQRGAALMGVLVAIVILGLMSGIAGSSWKTIVQRAKEEEVLWRGNQYRKAIASYYQSVQGGTTATLPSALDALVKDSRSVATQRHLRKLYPDPMTGEDWVPVKDPAGKIIGVHSNSLLEPFKQDGFSEENKDFAGKTSYSEWLFVFDVAAADKKAKDAAKSTPSTKTGS